MTLHIFGYPGCTTVKKARQWAEAKRLAPEYSHFSQVEDLPERLHEWIETAGFDAVFNAKSRTFKSLPEDQQALIAGDREEAIKAMTADPRLIKRPVATDGTAVVTGFAQPQWEKTFL